MEPYSSAEGGFSVDILSTWKPFTPKDSFLTPGTVSFSVNFSSESLEGKATAAIYALSIGRDKYASPHIQFKAQTAADRAAEMAYMLAVHESNGGKFRVARNGKSSHGIELWDFAIDADIGGQECKFIRLLTSIGDRETFEALWVTPCAQARKHKKEISAMVDSLIVKDAWPGTTAAGQ